MRRWEDQKVGRGEDLEGKKLRRSEGEKVRGEVG